VRRACVGSVEGWGCGCRERERDLPAMVFVPVLAVLSLCAAQAGASVDFLSGAARMNPQEVSRLLGSVEEKWTREATASFAGDTDGSDAFYHMEQSCFKVSKAIIDSSQGDRSSVSEYMDEVCEKSPTAKGVKALCEDFGVILLRYMSEDAGLNRENFDRKKFCKAVYSGKVSEFAEAANKAKEKVAEGEARRYAAGAAAKGADVAKAGKKAVAPAAEDYSIAEEPRQQPKPQQHSEQAAPPSIVDMVMAGETPPRLEPKRAAAPSIVDRVMAGEAPQEVEFSKKSSQEPLPERMVDGMEQMVESVASSVEAEASRLLGPVRRALASTAGKPSSSPGSSPQAPGWKLPDRFMERLEKSIEPRKAAGLTDEEANKLRPEDGEALPSSQAAITQPVRLAARHASKEVSAADGAWPVPAHKPLDYTLAVGAFPVGQLPAVPGAPLPGQSQALGVTARRGVAGKHAMSFGAQAALKAAMRREDEMKAAWASRQER